jgi:hypothetical protein
MTFRGWFFGGIADGMWTEDRPEEKQDTKRRERWKWEVEVVLSR